MMKTLIKSILVVAVMLGTYTGHANETLNVLPTIKLVNAGDQISVIDASGEVVFNEEIKYTGELTRLFDFSKLNDGIYKVEIVKDFEIETLNFQIMNNKIIPVKDSVEKIFKPVFRTEKSQLIVSKIAFDTNKMKVELYFEDELIYSEMVEGPEEILNRVYRLDATNRGEYTAIIKSNDRTYIENFRI